MKILNFQIVTYVVSTYFHPIGLIRPHSKFICCLNMHIFTFVVDSDQLMLLTKATQNTHLFRHNSWNTTGLHRSTIIRFIQKHYNNIIIIGNCVCGH